MKFEKHLRPARVFIPLIFLLLAACSSSPKPARTTPKPVPPTPAVETEKPRVDKPAPAVGEPARQVREDEEAAQAPSPQG